MFEISPSIYLYIIIWLLDTQRYACVFDILFVFVRSVYDLLSTNISSFTTPIVSYIHFHKTKSYAICNIDTRIPINKS